MRVVAEARCRTWEDIFEHILRPRVKKPVDAQEPAAAHAYQAKLEGEQTWAREWWNPLAPDEARFLARDGYLDVQLRENSRSQQLRRKPLPVGRPKQAQTRSHRVTVRLTDDEHARLLAAAERERCDPSEINRQALAVWK